MSKWNQTTNSADAAQCFAEFQSRYAEERSRYTDTAAYLRANAPEAVATLLAQAQEFLAGKMVLCGTEGKLYFVGNPPRWSDNPVGDKEYVWGLNRMAHWPVLTQAYYLTGDETYARKVLDELENWIDTCPPLEIVTDYPTAKERFSEQGPWRTLELGIRPIRSWNIVLQQLCMLPKFTQQLFEKVALSLYDHAEILYHVCPILWPKANHNHYLTECLGLLEISCLVPFFEKAPRWQAQAMRELERCAVNQILPAGGQIEGAPTYHTECLQQMTYSVQLARRYGLAFSPEYCELVSRMFRHSLYITRPNGENVPWGDSDPTVQLAESAFAHKEAFHDFEPLRVSLAVLGLPAVLAEFYKSIWKLSNVQALYDRLCTCAPGALGTAYPTLNHDREMKHVMMRTGWGKQDAGVYFSARSPVHNDHAHIDPNGFDYCNCGVAVFPDSGRFTYREGADRYYFKSGASHNTLEVNNRDAFAYEGTWAYGPQKTGSILAAGQADAVQYAVGRHDNYTPVVHTRVVGMAKDFLFVLDMLDGMQAEDTAQIYFQLNTPTASLGLQEASFTVADSDVQVCMAFCGHEKAEMLEGRISRQIDIADSSRRLRLTASSGSVFTVASVHRETPLYVKNVCVEEMQTEYRLTFTVGEAAYQYNINKETWKLEAKPQ